TVDAEYGQPAVYGAAVIGRRSQPLQPTEKLDLRSQGGYGRVQGKDIAFHNLLEIRCFQAGRRRFAHRLFVRLCLERGMLVRNVDV
ncbi:hypothetical protein, partial [Sphingorhabdus sp.]|uniref:hypothetical protein n=1 Tax=Sphingorhabdus sp. TaxID=1902408 RepID=UPI003783BE41